MRKQQPRLFRNCSSVVMKNPFESYTKLTTHVRYTMHFLRTHNTSIAVTTLHQKKYKTKQELIYLNALTVHLSVQYVNAHIAFESDLPMISGVNFLSQNRVYYSSSINARILWGLKFINYRFIVVGITVTTSL